MLSPSVKLIQLQLDTPEAQHCQAHTDTTWHTRSSTVSSSYSYSLTHQKLNIDKLIQIQHDTPGARLNSVKLIQLQHDTPGAQQCPAHTITTWHTMSSTVSSSYNYNMTHQELNSVKLIEFLICILLHCTGSLTNINQNPGPKIATTDTQYSVQVAWHRSNLSAVDIFISEREEGWHSFNRIITRWQRKSFRILIIAESCYTHLWISPYNLYIFRCLFIYKRNIYHVVLMNHFPLTFST